MTDVEAGEPGSPAEAPPPALPADLEAWMAPPPAAGRRVLLLAIVAGVAADVTLRSTGVGIAAAALPLVIAAALLGGGAVRTPAGRLALLPLPVLAPWIALRANGTTQLLDIVVCFACLALAVSCGPPHDIPAARADAGMPAIAVGMVTAPSYALRGVRGLTGAPGHSAIRAVFRGLAFAGPVVLLITILLADADRSFGALFGVDGVWAVVGHAALALAGAIGFLGLVRTSSVVRRRSAWRPPELGQVEASVVVAALAAVFALFAITRVLDLGTTVTGGRTAVLADEARAGFFQLVAVVVIAVLTLALVRTTVVRISRPLVVLTGAAVALTLVIVVVAIHRLLRYRDEYGLTQLRLGTTWFSAWLGLVVVLVGITFAVPRSLRRLPAVVIATGVVLLAGWNLSNADATIARTNIARATEGKRFDARFVGTMSADAVPAIVDGLDRLGPDQRAAVVEHLCRDRDLDPAGTTAWNASRARAADTLRPLCDG